MAVFVEILGSAAAVLTTGAFVPQVVQTVKTRSASDFSYGWLWSFLIGLVCWLIYGILIWSWPIIISNIITQIFVLTILLIELGLFKRSEKGRASTAMIKAAVGRYFEDFSLGETITHATPRTITSGDVALYQALYGARFAPQSSAPFAKQLGLTGAPIDDLLVFHIVFGKSVPDISLNAVANLGYAEGRFLQPVFAEDTLRATSKIIGLKENSNRKTGIVFVRTSGFNQNGDEVLSFARWVMVNKRDEKSPPPKETVPSIATELKAEDLVPPLARFENYDFKLAGAPHRWGDYKTGDKVDHIDGQTIEEAEHQLATRLYQNTAKVHFNAHAQATSRFGKRLVYGGHIISIARALSFNGLENAVHILALNAGTHVAPAFAGDTIYAWSEVLDVAAANRPDVGFLRLRTVATKNQDASTFPLRQTDQAFDPSVILDLDYWVAMPR